MSGLADRVRRARKDPVATAIAAATDLGIKFRWRGADLVITGAAALSVRDRAVLEHSLPQIMARLGNGDAAILRELGVTAELVTDPDRARLIVAGLLDSVGLDVETTPLPEHARPRQPLLITKKGERAIHQPKHDDPAGLDPHRARPRLVQVYDPSRETVFIFDLHHVPIEALDGLWSRRLVAHNAAFDHMMLGGRPVDLIDSMQIAGLALGCRRGSRRIGNVAGKILGINLQKDLQVSDWSAPRLSPEQLGYAAADAVVCYRAGRQMWRLLGERERRAFAIQNAAVPILSAMRVRGCPFDPGIHRKTIERWEVEHSQERARFLELTGEEPPGPSQIGAWLEAHLPPEEVARLDRTPTGAVSAKAAQLKRLAHLEEIWPLLRVRKTGTRLSSFGHSLVAMINLVTGRLHPDFMASGAETGRVSCSKPNLQQLPPDVRAAVEATPGMTLIAADYSQIELRVLASLCGDEAMRAVFAGGGDIHAEVAARICGVRVEEVSEDQRTAAKAIVFGTVYGSGARGLRASAWDGYDIDMSIEEAATAKEALLSTYPGIRTYQREQADLARQDGVLWSIAGRPLRASWETGGQILYTVAVNYAVQASAADVLLLAMANVERALPGLMILTVHDELVLLVPEDRADDVAAMLPEYMAAAFSELFPGEPMAKLVKVKVGPCWGDLK